VSIRRNELARCLADIDQCLAKAEDMTANPADDGERQAALEFLIEFQDAKRRGEAELSCE
jgi:hypothetical protein